MSLEHPVFRRFLYIIAIAVAAGELSGCQYFMPNPPAKHAKRKPGKHNAQAPSAVYAADSYVQQLTQARITLLDPSVTAADVDLDIVDGYPQQKSVKTAVQRLIVLEYTSSAGPSRYAIPYQEPTFSGLAEVMERLPSPTLNDIEIRTASISPATAAPLKTDNVRESLEGANKRLLQNAHRLPAMEDVRSQMALARFFIAHRFRDAAYLTVDNAKKQLATVSRNKDNSDSIKALAEEVEAIETQLHNEMPYTL